MMQNEGSSYRSIFVGMHRRLMGMLLLVEMRPSIGIRMEGALRIGQNRNTKAADITYGQARGAFNWAAENAQGINSMQPGPRCTSIFYSQSHFYNNGPL